MKSRMGIMARIGTVFLSWRRYCQKGYARYDITLKQVFLLGRLMKREYLNPSEIADLLYCDRPTATVIIKNMEKKGWIGRSRDSEDKKRSRVVLTAEGRKKHAEIFDAKNNPESRFNPEACFSPEERAELERLLVKLQDHLRNLPE